MTTLRFRKENEVKLDYKPRITEEVWADYKEIIASLLDAKTSREGILRILQDQYAFQPSLGQLNSQIKKWGLKVYRSRGTHQLGFNTSDCLPSNIEVHPRSSPGEHTSSTQSSASDLDQVSTNNPSLLSSASAESQSRLSVSVIDTSTVETEISDAPAEGFVFLSPKGRPTTGIKTLSQSSASFYSSNYGTSNLSMVPENYVATFSTIGDATIKVTNLDGSKSDEEMEADDEISELPANSLTLDLRSDTSRLREFKGLAYRLKVKTGVSARSQGSVMSIDSRESWDFSRVTGMSKYFIEFDPSEEEKDQDLHTPGIYDLPTLEKSMV